MTHRSPVLACPILMITLGYGCQVQEHTAALVRDTVHVGDHPIAVWSKTPREPEGVILLIHGRTWSSLPDFDLQVEGEDLSLMDGLVDYGYAAYAADMRGYGETPRDSTGWLSPTKAAADVAAVLEWLVAKPATAGKPFLLGWSQGSMISQLTVQQRPELVSGVILFGYPATPGAQIPVQEDPPVPARNATTAEAAASDFITPGSITQQALDSYVRQALAADPIRADWYRQHEWMMLDASRVAVPTLILQGEHDPLAPTEDQVALFATLGTADRELVTVAGGDHAAFLETPRPKFLSALVGFMRRHQFPSSMAPDVHGR